jgi:molybdopterin-guanine dinucleotide biosynthesis protein A
MPARSPVTQGPFNAEIVILAGGLSTRMGRDKSRVKVQGRGMLDWVRDAAKRTGLRVRTLRKDRVARCGPIGGVYTGLIGARADWVLFLACDMPFVAPAFLIKVLRAAIEVSRPAVTRVGRQSGFPMAIHRDMAGRVMGLIESREHALGGMARALRAKLVRAGPREAATLVNINCPGDLKSGVGPSPC